jgi:hypothetical protein
VEKACNRSQSFYLSNDDEAESAPIHDAVLRGLSYDRKNGCNNEELGGFGRCGTGRKKPWVRVAKTPDALKVMAENLVAVVYLDSVVGLIDFGTPLFYFMSNFK